MPFLGVRVGIPGALGGARVPAYDPVAGLGADLLGYWDANRSDLITRDGSNLVASWKDIVAGYDAAQGTGSAKPTYSATSLNGAPGVGFDGIDDCLTLVLSGQFPTGGTASEIWAVFQQDALVADTTTRRLVSYGGSGLTSASTNASRCTQRIVVTGANRGGAITGTGATAISANDAAVDLSTRHVIRNEIGATTTTITVDGGSPVSQAAVPGTGTTQIRLGASSMTSAAFFWQGQAAAILITNPLSAAKAAALQTYLLSRRKL